MAGSIQAYVNTPDGLRIEILENKNQPMPIQSEHVHFFLPEADIAKSQAWYAKIFGAKASVRNNAPVADIPGVQLRFNKADAAQAPTKGRVLDHIGFDVKDLKAFIKTLEANNVKLDRPYTVNDAGIGIAFVTDPCGTNIEINERPPAIDKSEQVVARMSEATSGSNGCGRGSPLTRIAAISTSRTRGRLPA